MQQLRILKINHAFDWRLEEPTVKDGRIVAVCDLLGLTIEAETLDDLHESMKSAVTLLFRDLVREQELEQFCRVRNIDFAFESVVQQAPPTFVLGQTGDALSL